MLFRTVLGPLGHLIPELERPGHLLLQVRRDRASRDNRTRRLGLALRHGVQAEEILVGSSGDFLCIDKA